MAQTHSSPKLDRSLLRAKRDRKAVRGNVGDVLTFGLSAAGLGLTIIFGVTAFFGITANSVSAGEAIYPENAEFRTKGLKVPTSDELKLVNIKTRGMLETYLEVQKSRNLQDLQSLDESYGQIMRREADNADDETLSHLAAVHGETCLKRGDLDEALHLFEEARRYSADNPWALDGLRRAVLAKQKAMGDDAGSWTEDEQRELKELIDRAEALERELSVLLATKLQAWLDNGEPGHEVWSFSHGEPEYHRFLFEQYARFSEAHEMVERAKHAARGIGESRSSKCALGDSALASARRDGRRALIIESHRSSESSTLDNYSFDKLTRTHRDNAGIAGTFDNLGFDVATVSGNPRALLRELLAEVDSSRPTDELVLYYSGHGFTDVAGTAVLATADNTDDLITVEEIETVLSHHRGTATLILDTCRDRRNTIAVNVGDLTSWRGANSPAILWATGDGDVAIESDRLDGSAFTVALRRFLEQLASEAGSNERQEAIDAEFDGFLNCHDSIGCSYTGDDRSGSTCSTFSTTRFDLVTAFDAISAETERLAMQHHGVKQVPQMSIRP